MTLYRAATVTDYDINGRDLTVVAVPFDRPTLVRDSPTTDPYLERWSYEAFRYVKRDAARTELRLQHTPTRLGVCTALREDSDHLVADFHLDDTDDAHAAVAAISSGDLLGASIGADMHPQGSRTDVDADTGAPVIVRHRVLRLPEVSLTPRPAFPEARVLALREQPDDTRLLTLRAERTWWGLH